MSSKASKQIFGLHSDVPDKLSFFKTYLTSLIGCQTNLNKSKESAIHIFHDIKADKQLHKLKVIV